MGRDGITISILASDEAFRLVTMVTGELIGELCKVNQQQ